MINRRVNRVISFFSREPIYIVDAFLLSLRIIRVAFGKLPALVVFTHLITSPHQTTMAPNGKKKSAPSFEDVEAKRLEMVKSLTAVADAMQLATTSVRAYLELSPGALTEDPATAALTAKKRKAADKKKAKDPNAPKRPVTGYLAYSKDHMHKLKEQNPDMPHKALVGLVTEQWNNLPEEEKKVSAACDRVARFVVLMMRPAV